MRNNPEVNNKIGIHRKRIQYHQSKQKKARLKKRKLNPTPFSAADDELILHLVGEVGPKFDLISVFFPERSLNHVKNRYYKHLRLDVTPSTDSPLAASIQSPSNEIKVDISNTSLIIGSFSDFEKDLSPLQLDQNVEDIMSKLFSQLDSWVDLQY